MLNILKIPRVLPIANLTWQIAKLTWQIANLTWKIANYPLFPGDKLLFADLFNNKDGNLLKFLDFLESFTGILLVLEIFLSFTLLHCGGQGQGQGQGQVKFYTPTIFCKMNN